LGLHQLGGRAQQWLAWKFKAGRDTWFLVNNQRFIHEQQKENICFGPRLEPNDQIAPKLHCMVTTILYGLRPY
jgi:hypothetical protein